MKKIIYALLLILLGTSCQRGEEIAPFTELSNIFLFTGFDNVSISRNGEQLSVSQRLIKVPLGEAVYSFRDADGNMLLEQSMEFLNNRDTISFSNNGEASFVGRSLGSVPVNPLRIKVDVANLSSFNAGAAVNLIAYKIDAGLNILSDSEEVSDVSNVLSNNYTELDLDGFASTDPAEAGQFMIFFYVVDDNMQPYLKDGYPIAFAAIPQLDFLNTGASLHKVYQIILRDVDSNIIGPMDGIGAYPQGAYVYFAEVFQSKR